MDSELIDIFTYRLLADIPQMQEEIALLSHQQETAIPKLFRHFHNYKASASYLELDVLSQLVSQGENILNAMRSQNNTATQHDINWLNAAISQLKTWCSQLMVNEPLSPIDNRLFPSIAILDEGKKSVEIMQTLNLLYADPDASRAEKIQAPLAHVFKRVSTVTDVNAIKTAVLNNACDIVILNMQAESITIAQELTAIKPDIGLITVVPGLKAYQRTRLLIQGVTHPIGAPIKSSELKRQLHNIVTSHFSKIYSLISHEKIYNFIQGLDPLPSSVREITQLCDEPDSSIKDLIKAIETDSVTTAGILHAASMPIYGVKPTSSVEQAVVAFGKRMIKALTLSDLACKVGSMNLDAYEITETQFKQSSRMRLALMQQWYSRVNSNELSLLCSTAILGNLGEILINKEILQSDLQERFRSYENTQITQAEVDLLKTSAAFVTADVLEFWNLESELVDAIRYSDSPFNAPDNRLQSLAAANAVVYKMVTPQGELLNELSDEVRALMLKSSYEISTLEDAVRQLKAKENEEEGS